MTLQAFRILIATLPESIDIVRYKGLNDVLPRIVWGEARIEQEYASDRACTERTAVALEYMTRKEDDPNVQVIKDVFRRAKLPFICEAGYDADGDYISYMFNLWFEEEV